MIDYEKLKIGQKVFIVHVDTLNDDRLNICISTQYVTKLEHSSEPYDGLFYCTKSKYCDLHIERRREDIFVSMQDAIEHIKELTQDKPKPKYAVGQILFFLMNHGSEVFDFEVGRIEWIDGGFSYYEYGTNAGVEERFVYPSKQALIEAQIHYWSDLKCK